MFRPLVILLSVMLVLTSCGRIRDSRLNPFNWFGRSQPIETVAVDAGRPVDPRPLVAQVLTLNVDAVQGGAIVRAKGLPPTQGYWNGALVPLELDENGVQVYEFRIAPPFQPNPVVNQFSREVTVGAFVTNRQLESIRQIVVQGSGNALSSRR